MPFTASNNQYFEGILQLRNSNEEIDSFINSQLRKSGAFISRIRRARNGIDLYISSQHFLQNLGKKLKSNFGGELHVSKKLYSVNRQTSREVYRITVLYRAPDYRKGDIVKQGRKLILVTEIDKRIHGLDISTLKRFSAEPKDIEILDKKKTTVAKVYPELEILEPDTYQPCRIRNKTTKKYNQGEKVTVVYDDGYWLVP